MARKRTQKQQKQRRGRPPATDPHSADLSIRCKPAQKSAWLQAAGGPQHLAAWVRTTLDAATPAR